jgi:predicted ribonuclease YlaK
LIRGASWPDSVIIADEMQNASWHETLTFGTRVGENSKVILLGDLNQRDTKSSIENTGLYKFINSPIVKENPIAASIHLIKSERGEVSALFSKVFDEV